MVKKRRSTKKKKFSKFTIFISSKICNVWKRAGKKQFDSSKLASFKKYEKFVILLDMKTLAI